MSRSNDRKLGEVIAELIAAYRYSDKFNEIDIRRYWKATFGDSINKHTLKIFINKRVLHVMLNSSALRNELSMAKTALIEDINRHAGKAIIDDIQFA